MCSADDVLKACQSDDFEEYDIVAEIQNEDDLYYKLEGYLFPDTYDFYKGEDANSVLSKMVYNTSKKLSTDLRDAIEKKGMTIQEVLTLASIVQAEASDEADMYKIAAILENRLESGSKCEYLSSGLRLDHLLSLSYEGRRARRRTGYLCKPVRHVYHHRAAGRSHLQPGYRRDPRWYWTPPRK